MKRYGVICGVEVGRVTVIPERSSSCGSCHACLGSDGGVCPLPALCSLAVIPGERVEIESIGSTGQVMLQILKLFLLPLFGFWLGFGLMIASCGEVVAGLSGIAVFFLVFFCIRIFEKKKDSAGRCLYRVVRKVKNL